MARNIFVVFLPFHVLLFPGPRSINNQAQTSMGKYSFILAILVAVAFAVLLIHPSVKHASARSAVAGVSGPDFHTVSKFAESVPLSSVSSSQVGRTSTPPQAREIRQNQPQFPSSENVAKDEDGAVATTSLVGMPDPSISFDGLSNENNTEVFGLLILPPDVNGDVGPNHYVQIVNSLIRVFSKTGQTLTPPLPISTLFQQLGTSCSVRNDGQAIVLYDALADRWLISQVCTLFPPFRQMVAVSKTGDPTGAYFAYEFIMPSVRINDFPKFGVWPDGYYMSMSEVLGSDYVGDGAIAFDRERMLKGDPSAGFIYFYRPVIAPTLRGGTLPSDLDGLTPPPAGAPNVFAGYSATEYGDAADAVRLFNFHADFAHPENSTFEERPESPLTVAAFDPTSPDGRADIAQPPPGERLDSSSDAPNYRLAYRNLGDRESLIFNQTVRTSPVGQTYRAGTRVHELHRSGAAYGVYDSSTIGDNLISRWVASAAQDRMGNVAVQFDEANEQKKISINYTGRLAAEPAGSFRTENSIVIGTGVQTGFGYRWGEYSGLSVDPADDCTFWMTNGYYSLESQNFSEFGWLTRIGAFKFPECSAAPRSTIVGLVTNSATGQPVSSAVIKANVFSRASDASGSYGPLAVPPGEYTFVASADGFRSETRDSHGRKWKAVHREFLARPHSHNNGQRYADHDRIVPTEQRSGTRRARRPRCLIQKCGPGFGRFIKCKASFQPLSERDRAVAKLWNAGGGRRKHHEKF